MAETPREWTVGAYFGAVWHHWKLLALDLLLGAVGVVDSAARFRTTTQAIPRTPARIVHHPFLPGWAWVIAFGVVLVLVQFRAWRDIYRRPLSRDHTETLREIARHVEGSLGSPEITYRTASGRTDDYIRGMFRDHFPDLAVLLDLWDNLAVAESIADAGLYAVISTELNSKFPNGDGWATAGMLRTCWDRVTRRNADVQQAPAIHWNRNAIIFAQTVIRYYDNIDSDDPPEDAANAIESLKAWVLSISTLPAWTQRTIVLSHRPQLRKEIQQALLPIINADRLWGRCDACRPQNVSAAYQASIKAHDE